MRTHNAVTEVQTVSLEDELAFATLSGEVLDQSERVEWTGDPYRHYHRSQFGINMGITRVAPRW